MLTRDEFARQAAWPRERVHGWAPGNYSCTCGDCGVHYLGDKRSVQCYPCASKFVPPPRPETLEEIRADRDRLAAELARVRRNHLRRMERRAEELAGPWRSIFAGIPEEHRNPHAWRYRWLQRVEKVRDACRAALAQTQDGQA